MSEPIEQVITNKKYVGNYQINTDKIYYPSAPPDYEE